MPKASNFDEILHGASINQLAQLFELDRKTVRERLKEAAKPSGARSGHAIYRIADVAPLLVQGYLRDSDLKQMGKLRKSSDAKDYWDAKLKEQKFKENRGDLWRTEKVISVITELLKYARESMTVFMDNLEHESGLPKEVIERCKGFGDGFLIEMREKLINMEIDPIDDHDDPDEVEELEDNTMLDDEDNDLLELGLLGDE